MQVLKKLKIKNLNERELKFLKMLCTQEQIQKIQEQVQKINQITKKPYN